MVRICLFPLQLKTYRNQAIAAFHRNEMERQKEKMKVAKGNNKAENGGNDAKTKGGISNLGI
jgi:hypothetical protein